jgi:hypothetical protein
MTNNIYPPDHLLRKWESLIIDEEQNVDVVLYEAFQAGADQELEACCKWLPKLPPWSADDLRRHRRPKPPSLNEVALQMLSTIERDARYLPEITDTIRRALEQLND